MLSLNSFFSFLQKKSVAQLTSSLLFICVLYWNLIWHHFFFYLSTAFDTLTWMEGLMFPTTHCPRDSRLSLSLFFFFFFFTLFTNFCCCCCYCTNYRFFYNINLITTQINNIFQFSLFIVNSTYFQIRLIHIPTYFNFKLIKKNTHTHTFSGVNVLIIIIFHADMLLSQRV